MASVEEPMLSRLNRLDNILKQLEEIRSVSPKSSSYASTASSDITSSADDVSPRSTLEKKMKRICFYRPIDEVMMEVEEKGTLLERLVHAEDRILKICLQLEDELESERTSKELQQHQTTSDETVMANKKTKIKKSPLKKLMKSFVGGKEKHNHDN